MSGTGYHAMKEGIYQAFRRISRGGCLRIALSSMAGPNNQARLPESWCDRGSTPYVCFKRWSQQVQLHEKPTTNYYISGELETGTLARDGHSSKIYETDNYRVQGGVVSSHCQTA
jgi:hypothetical protein